MTITEADSNMLKVTSNAFKDGQYMPVDYTGFGKDMSPDFRLHNLSKKAVSIAIIMDDLDIPFLPAYNHWLIWNIPAMQEIPEKIPHGPEIPGLGNARQGIAYGKNKYRGPKQPVFIRNMHRYVFRIYVLDCFLDLTAASVKKDLTEAMEGHVLQQGRIMGKYKRK